MAGHRKRLARAARSLLRLTRAVATCRLECEQEELLMALALMPSRAADLDRLGDEIAALAAHLDAATARLLELILRVRRP